jgi:hypothetical protein
MSKRKPTTRKGFKPFAINHMDSITILCTYQSLHMAARHQMYLAHPSNIRQSAVHWLEKVGVTMSKGARWNTLLKEFCDSFRSILPIDADNNPVTKDKPPTDSI